MIILTLQFQSILLFNLYALLLPLAHLVSILDIERNGYLKGRVQLLPTENKYVVLDLGNKSLVTRALGVEKLVTWEGFSYTHGYGFPFCSTILPRVVTCLYLVLDGSLDFRISLLLSCGPEVKHFGFQSLCFSISLLNDKQTPKCGGA